MTTERLRQILNDTTVRLQKGKEANPDLELIDMEVLIVGVDIERAKAA